MHIEITKNPVATHRWCVDEMAGGYGEDYFVHCAAAFGADASGKHEQCAMIFRIIIEKGPLRSVRQKYGVFVRFYAFGETATVDIVSMDREHHREIAEEHLRRMRWDDYGEGLGQSAGFLDATESLPFLTAGGHLATDGSKAAFYGSDDGYGDRFFFTDADALAACAAAACGMMIDRGNIQAGGAFIRETLEFMCEHGGKDDFYEQLVDRVLARTKGGTHPFTAERAGAILIMKVLDRDLAEKKPKRIIMREEVKSGLLKHLSARAGGRNRAGK